MPRKSSTVKAAPPETAPAPPPASAHIGLTLLEVADPADLRALEADPRIRPLLVRILSDRHAAVLPGSHAALLEALRKAGHTPKVQGGA